MTIAKIDGETEIRNLDIDVPAWIDQDLTIYDVDAITQGGCASGAYMPAVTYQTARDTMNTHGDDILDYISDTDTAAICNDDRQWLGRGELPAIPSDISWSGLAVFFLSYAIELFADSLESDLEQYNRD
jgi:hypothetical protein